MLNLRRSFFTFFLVLVWSAADAQITSDFAANVDGWGAPDAITGAQYSSVVGNPPGSISAAPYSIVLGAVTIYGPYYFIAPAKFRGDRSTYYNGTLRYHVQQTTTNTSDQTAEVVIYNSAGIAIFYYPTTPFQPPAQPNWGIFTVVLNNLAGFWKSTDSPTGPAVTEAVFQTYMADLSSLRIRGLYRQANTTTRLDNVTMYPPIIITQQPSPSSVCLGATATFTTGASNNSAITYRWQRETSPGTYTDINNGGGYSGATTATLTVNTTGNFGAGNHRCRISGLNVVDAFTSIVSLTINNPPAPPATTDVSRCDVGPVALTATGGSPGQYRWYTGSSGGTAIVGSTSGTYSTPVLLATTTYYVAINNGSCESTRTPVTATVNTPPGAPTTTGNASCGSANVELSASGGDAGEYRWYTASSGGTALAGVVNGVYTTPVLTATTTYYVALSENSCESPRTPVTATINTIPAAPTTNGDTSCPGTGVTLTASGGTNGQYRWYTASTGGSAITGQVNSTFATPVLTATTTYYVAINNGSCESTRTSVIANIGGSSCNNQPPIIETQPSSTQIGGTIQIDLSDLISDADNNLDLTTLTIVNPPASGAQATLTNNILTINYTGISFTGIESITIRVCDFFAACTQQTFPIEVDGAIEVFNAVSPRRDGKNDVFYIQNIDKLPDTQKNHVGIYNRWGDLVWEGDNYNNASVAFSGKSKNDTDLPSGTYFYKIEFSGKRGTMTGYLSLKR